MIDDEKTVLDVAESVLTRKGAKVLTAPDGKRGIDMFRMHNRSISAIILDLQMPVMGGEEALPLLHEINPSVPIILSSGFDESDATRRFTSPKPASFLQKPFTAQRLVSAVASALRDRKSQT